MRSLLGIAVLAVLAALPHLSDAANTPNGRDLPQSYLFTPAGRLTPLHAGVAYRASQFPLEVRITPPEPGWSGTQWRSGDQYFRGGGPPHYGWVHLGRGAPAGVPGGLISVMTAYARTPSVAAIANVLRTRGRGATYGATTSATIGGFRGIQFDGQIVGAKNLDHIGHFFVPFSPRSSAARYYPDEYGVYGDVFRVLVIGVRGKTVVIYIENGGLPAERFPAFLIRAERMLAGLRFTP